MNPGSVAVIGASRRTGKGSFNLIENMREFGFTGRIFPVNPLAEEIMGLEVFKSVGEIGEAVDLAVIAAPRQEIPRLLEECADQGIKGAILVPQGFADADETGRALQESLTRIARERGIRALGPNTLGVVDAFSGFSSSFMPLPRDRSPVGLICQSGLFFVGAPIFTGLIGKAIDVGNGCDVGFCDALEYFEHDDDIRLVFIHMEGVGPGRRFMEAARRVARRKPIVALKAARSPSGAKAAASHTGSLVGDALVYDAAFQRAGIIPVRGQEEIHDSVKALLSAPLMQGRRVAVITFTGAGGIMLIDALDARGLELARLSPETIRRVQDVSPPWMPIGNPLDIWPALMKQGMGHVYRLTLEAVLQDEAVDGVVCIAIAPDLPENEHLDATGVIGETAALYPGKPVTAWLYGPNQAEVSRRLEAGGRVVVLPSLERAARTLAVLHHRFKILRDLDRV
ncbi:MAG: CoA-binding protein [Proteobacteria bacterium]|nr:CoA-binding protein [Pseudomonadota bacterium]